MPNNFPSLCQKLKGKTILERFEALESQFKEEPPIEAIVAFIELENAKSLLVAENDELLAQCYEFEKYLRENLDEELYVACVETWDDTPRVLYLGQTIFAVMAARLSKKQRANVALLAAFLTSIQAERGITFIGDEVAEQYTFPYIEDAEHKKDMDGAIHALAGEFFLQGAGVMVVRVVNKDEGKDVMYGFRALAGHAECLGAEHLQDVHEMSEEALPTPDYDVTYQTAPLIFFQ